MLDAEGGAEALAVRPLRGDAVRADGDRRSAATKAWQAAALEPITLHECRHTFASLLIDSDANPKAVQEFMGHSKIADHLRHLRAPVPGSRDEVRERMDAYLAAGEVLTGELTGEQAAANRAS